MRRRTIKRAAEILVNALPDEESLQASIARSVEGQFAASRENVETAAKQLATQQQLAAEWEAKKPGSFRARSFAKTVETWQARTDEAIAKYDELAARHGRSAWGEADQ